MEDLGWICVNSWRFGEIDKPVGGFGTREELFGQATRRPAAVPIRPRKFWEVMGNTALGRDVLRHDAAAFAQAPTIRWSVP